ncbi:MAG: 1-acyl-sn-glycerol-3-phosphate acyltransferase [Spirochaetia bacterium]|nr:1-acyl-sn-glycerol-3-phosphate acyltransferase [Spirochaetia bacterium]
MENEKSASQAPWQKEFFKNIESFIKLGINQDAAREMLLKFLKLSAATPQPKVLDCFRFEDALDKVGVYTQSIPGIRDFMVEFLEPLMKNFSVEGIENLEEVIPVLDKFPMTLISNHVSHLDAPAIYNLLYREGGNARKLAESLVFVAGRLAFEPDFTRLGLYMFDTLLVCSRRDMSENPGQATIMTKINMRAFRQSLQLQKKGKVIAIFPEGTRSRTGHLGNFVDSVYHYVTNKIIIPVSLSGTDEILPTSSFLFRAAQGKLTIGKPILVGEFTEKQMNELPASIEKMHIKEGTDKKKFIVENLALYIGKNLHRHKHGVYRNLYRSTLEETQSGELISSPENPQYKIAAIGNSSPSTAFSSILANHACSIDIYIRDKNLAETMNSERIDTENFPLFYIPPTINFTSDPSVLEKADIILQGVRPWEMDEYYPQISEILKKSKAMFVNIAKGLTNSEYGLILEDLQKKYGISPDRFAAVSGATTPYQIMERKVSGLEIAANNPEDLKTLLQLFSTGYSFARPASVHDDLKGVQLGGALKNIYALGIGLLDGYYEKSLGGNSDSSLFHASYYMFREMTEVSCELGGKKETLMGLSGHTDFMQACFGSATRDRDYGKAISSGNFQTESQSSGLYGIRSLAGLLEIQKFPILHSIYRLIVNREEFEPVMSEVYEQLRNLDRHLK